MSDKPTKAQLVQLERAARDPLGTVKMYYKGGFAFVNWRRMMQRLCTRGWFASYYDGEYVITEAGRNTLTGEVKREG